MEEFSIDQTADIYHQARKVAYACPAFRNEVEKEKNSSVKFLLIILIFSIGRTLFIVRMD